MLEEVKMESILKVEKNREV
jgi:hypothetical protein